MIGPSVQLDELPLDPEGAAPPQLNPGGEGAQLDRMGAYCRDIYEECRVSAYRRRKLEEERIANRKKYRGDRDAKVKPWKGCSNKSLMIDATVIDNLEPRVMAGLFGDKDFVDVEPVGEEDIQGAKMAKDFLIWALLTNMDIEAQLKPAVHDCLLDGTAIIIPIWEEHTRMSMLREPVPKFESHAGPVNISPEEVNTPMVQALIANGTVWFSGFGERIKWRTTREFRVKIEQVPLNDAFFPDSGLAWDEQPFMRMIYPLYHELEALSEANGGPYRNISRDLILGQSRSDTDQPDRDQQLKDVRYSDYSEECPLLECHVLWEGEWWLVTYSIHMGWREVRRQPMREVYAHGRKAPRRLAIFRESNESMGTGLPWKIRHFSDGCDDLYNQMIDNGTLENMPWFLIEETFGTFQNDQEIAPGKGITVPKGSNPQFPRFASDSSRFIGFIELLLQMQERLISLMSYTQSGQINQGSAGSETYSGMALLVNEGNIRTAYTTQGLRNEISSLVRDILSLYGQYLPYDEKRRIADGDNITFEPFDLQAIQGQYDIKIRVSSNSGNKMLKRQERSELYDRLGGNPIVDQQKLVVDILDSYDVKDGSAYINPQLNELVQLFLQDPSVLGAAQQHMQQQAEAARQQELQQQAQANIERQMVQRQAEAPLENDKIVDQVTESTKRRMAAPAIGQRVAEQMMMGQM